MSNLDGHYEQIAKLYLRLKGFWVNNLIIHSDEKGKNKSELDILAIRLPYHSQDFRQVDVDDYLNCSEDRIEIVIADVKNTKSLRKVKYNDGLKKDKGSIKQLINWIGLVKKTDQALVEKFTNCLNMHDNEHSGYTTLTQDLEHGKFNIKFTFFCPSLNKWDKSINKTGYKYIHGDEMFDFIWSCLNTSKKIPTCSRRYGYDGWKDLTVYVKFFKNKDQKVTIEQFEDHFKDKTP